jgi:hypothetical protein
VIHKTLQEIEGEDWGEPAFLSSLVINCHRLRRVPLKDFTVGDLRLMIGQAIGLPYLIPLAFQVLRENPLVEGDFYEGDLLSNVSQVPEQFWVTHPELKGEFDKITANAIAEIEVLGNDAPSVLVELKQRLML